MTAPVQRIARPPPLQGASHDEICNTAIGFAVWAFSLKSDAKSDKKEDGELEGEIAQLGRGRSLRRHRPPRDLVGLFWCEAEHS